MYFKELLCCTKTVRALEQTLEKRWEGNAESCLKHSILKTSRRNIGGLTRAFRVFKWCWSVVSLEFVQHKKTNEYSFVVVVTWLCLLCWRWDGDGVYLPAQRLECCRNRVTMKTLVCVLMCRAQRWTLWVCAAAMWSRLLMTAAAAPCGFNNSRSRIVPTSKPALTL